MAIYYVDGDNGNDAWDGLYETPQGGLSGPIATVAQGMNMIAKSDELRIIKAAAAYDYGGISLPALGAVQESERFAMRGWVIGQAATDIVLPASRPVISALTGSGADIIDLSDNDYISLVDLELNDAQSGFDGIDGNLASYLRVRRCLISNVDQGYNATNGPITDVIIEDNEISYCADAIKSSTGNIGITIRRNYIHHMLDGGTAGDGIQLQHEVDTPLLADVLIEDNLLEDIEKQPITVSGCRTGTCIIRRNRIDCTGQTVDPSDAISITSCLDFDIEENLILDPNGNGIYASEGTLGVTLYLSGAGTIKNNLVLFSGATESFKRGIYIHSHDGAEGPLDIIGNTVYGTAEGVGGGGEGIMYRLDTGDAAGNPVCNIHNNISAGNDDNGLEIRGTYAGGTVTVNNDYNCYFDNGAADISDGNGWGNSPETNGVTSDPQLIDPANWNVNLAPTSPCIGAGNPAETSQHGRAPDIGAREYGAPVTRQTGTAGRPARMRHGKYYRGSSAVDGLLEFVRMER